MRAKASISPAVQPFDGARPTVTPGLVPGVHVVERTALAEGAEIVRQPRSRLSTWMAGTSPAMTAPALNATMKDA